MTIDVWLRQAAKLLHSAGSESPSLDAQLLLAQTFDQDRAWLLAHGHDELGADVKSKADALRDRRASGEPVAYILGYREFYGRQYTVTHDVLIPRPESEAFLQLLQNIVTPHTCTLLDIGTGSGCLAISAKLTYPHLAVTATDISSMALGIARHNAALLDADVRFAQADLAANSVAVYDVVLANLPYVPREFKVSADVHREPPLAVFGGSDGLDLLRELATTIDSCVSARGYLLLESLEIQHGQVASIYQKAGFRLLRTAGLVQMFQRG